jgi:hypothetical protein
MKSPAGLPKKNMLPKSLTVILKHFQCGFIFIEIFQFMRVLYLGNFLAWLSHAADSIATDKAEVFPFEGTTGKNVL